MGVCLNDGETIVEYANLLKYPIKMDGLKITVNIYY